MPSIRIERQENAFRGSAIDSNHLQRLLLSASYRVDLVVEDLVVVEVKSVAELAHGLAALPGQMTVDSALRPISADPPDRTEN